MWAVVFFDTAPNKLESLCGFVEFTAVHQSINAHDAGAW
jgi:hypothetical protein